ncbi:hypothetical protein SNOG_02433 [Parastagonospora nodorum SN15]|uniref:Uncharacterized protein n=1 Tax=Phaeosphaeria nodorum (strain SN15 / ATCC MYA-4574 / FGSC 10173) TaxID=321614 RepID=Q0V0N1_PHANO|nr:hypothetical protein SNOG_02433 [Parastagonospora nodorum SN15]EAT90645.1 hypothetical protein SNOG_02433 [Parastagonospora nodorum SN15]
MALDLWVLHRCIAGLFHELVVQPREIFSPVSRALRAVQAPFSVEFLPPSSGTCRSPTPNVTITTPTS